MQNTLGRGVCVGLQVPRSHHCTPASQSALCAHNAPHCWEDYAAWRLSLGFSGVCDLCGANDWGCSSTSSCAEPLNACLVPFGLVGGTAQQRQSSQYSYTCVQLVGDIGKHDTCSSTHYSEAGMSCHFLHPWGRENFQLCPAHAAPAAGIVCWVVLLLWVG
jgi:hypothetical protein